MKATAVHFVALLALLAATGARLRAQPVYSISTVAGKTGDPGWVDGSFATARFNGPMGMAIDSAGNIFVAESGWQKYDSAGNVVGGGHIIRKITPAGSVSTLAGQAGKAGSADGAGSAASFDGPNAIAVDRAENLYVADSQNHTIRKITAEGIVTTLAGKAGERGSSDGAGIDARFDTPEGIALDGAGNLYVADTLNYTIRKITPAGHVATIAGMPKVSAWPLSGDGVGSAARFYYPSALAIDAAGTLYVADYHAMRKVTPAGDDLGGAGQ